MFTMVDLNFDINLIKVSKLIVPKVLSEIIFDINFDGYYIATYAISVILFPIYFTC